VLSSANKISLEKIVEKMAHAPAECFRIEKRGFIREGYWADLTVFDLNQKELVNVEGLYYKCGWSPFEGHQFGSKVLKTFVSGELIYDEGKFFNKKSGQRLKFDA